MARAITTRPILTFSGGIIYTNFARLRGRFRKTLHDLYYPGVVLVRSDSEIILKGEETFRDAYLRQHATKRVQSWTNLSLSHWRNCSPTWRHEFQGTTPILGVHNPPGFLTAAFDIESENALDLLHKFWTLLHFE